MPNTPVEPLHARTLAPAALWRRLAAQLGTRLAAPLGRRLPSRCQVCHAWPAQAVCEACVARFVQLHPRCTTCALAVPAGQARCGECQRQPPPLDACFTAVAYAYPWSDLVARFKFQHQPGAAQPMVQLLRSMPFVEPALEQADWIVPMPLSRERLRERGYNQAWELARRLAPGTAKGQPGMLLRVIDTAPQAGLKRAERLRNLRAALAVDPWQTGRLHGSRVVLVDDVMTSGASLHAAALVLRAAGASHITGLVFARTDAPH